MATDEEKKSGKAAATLAVDLGLANEASGDDCSRAVLFQVKEGNILPGGNVHFIFYGVNDTCLEEYTILHSELQPCSLLGYNTIAGTFKTDVTFQGTSKVESLPWPTPGLIYARTKSGIVGIKDDNTLKALQSKRMDLSPLVFTRKGYCCVEYMDNTVEAIVGVVEVMVQPPKSKEYFHSVSSGLNPFFIMKAGKLVKVIMVEIPEAEADESVPTDQWYSVNLFFVDADTGAALPGVAISLGSGLSGVSGSAGQVFFNNMTPGVYPLSTSKSGYYGNLQDDIDNNSVNIG